MRFLGFCFSSFGSLGCCFFICGSLFSTTVYATATTLCCCGSLFAFGCGSVNLFSLTLFKAFGHCRAYGVEDYLD